MFDKSNKKKNRYYNEKPDKTISTSQATTEVILEEAKKESPDDYKIQLEISLKDLYDSPHRQTNEWNAELDSVLRKYLKLNNPRMFKSL